MRRRMLLMGGGSRLGSAGRLPQPLASERQRLRLEIGEEVSGQAAAGGQWAAGGPHAASIGKATGL